MVYSRWCMCGFVAMTMLLSCGGKGQEGEVLPSVVASIPPLEYFARAIGGDSVRVTSLLTESSDPETFSPGISAMRELASSDLFVTVGVLPFENALLDNIKKNNPELEVVEVSDGIELLYGTHSHGDGEAAESHGHVGGADPHVWSSVRNARIIADNMLEAFVSVAPQYRAYFEKRHDRLVERLDSLDRSVGDRLKRSRRDSFAVWHPSLSYFARDYGLTQIAFNVENKETSSLRLRGQLDDAKRHGAGALIVPAGVGDDKVAAVAEGLGVLPVWVNLMSADWEGEMEKVAEAISGE